MSYPQNAHHGAGSSKHRNTLVVPAQYRNLMDPPSNWLAAGKSQRLPSGYWRRLDYSPSAPCTGNCKRTEQAADSRSLQPRSEGDSGKERAAEGVQCSAPPGGP